MMAEIPESRLPTVFGSRFVQLFVAAFLFIALLNGQRDLILFAIVLLGITNGADLWSRFSRFNLITSSAIDKSKVFPGESIELTLDVANKKWLPVWLRMKLPIPDDLEPLGEEKRFARESGLLWFQQVRFSWVLTPQKRGIYPLGPPRMTVGDLMGFYPRQTGGERELEIIVYPRLIPLKPLTLPKRDFFGIPGAKSPVQDPVYIMGTREYQHGRSARAIHWKASARRNRLQEKIFEPSEQAKILIVVDVDGYAENYAHDDFEQTLEVAASLAIECDRQTFAIGLATNGMVQGSRLSVFPPVHGPLQLARILETLAGLTMDVRENISTAIKTSTLLGAGVSCIGFAYEENETTLQHIEYLYRHHIPAISFFNRKEESMNKIRSSKIYAAYGLDEIRSPGVRSK